MNLNDLYTKATSDLLNFRKDNPGVQAVIAGGFLRDITLDRAPRDCDAFIEMPLGVTVTEMSLLMEPHFGYTYWSSVIPEEYRTIPGIAAIGAADPVLPITDLDDIGVCYNIVLLLPGFDPIEDAKQNDFGICQIWDTGWCIGHTEAFVKDLNDQTFTLSVCEDETQHARSMRRWEKLSPRFPGWTLVDPTPWATQG